MKMKFLVAILILTGASLAAGGVYLLAVPPPMEGDLDGAAGILAFLPGGLLLLFAALVWAVWVPIVARTDHGALLRTGEPATATVVAVTDTGSTLNQQPVFKFTLDVMRSGAAVYRAQVRQIVARPALGVLRPGLVVPVRVDPRRPHRVAIDSTATATGHAGPVPGSPLPSARTMPAAEAAAAWAGGRIPTANAMRAADIVRDGVAATATIRSATPTGLTVGQVQQPSDPATAGDPLFMLVLQVATAEGGMVTAQGVHRVPIGQLTGVAPGQRVPVAYLPGDPAGTTTVAWDRLDPG